MPQRRIESNLVRGVAGMPYAGPHSRDVITAINDDPRAKQIITFDIDDSATEADLTLEGVLIESDSGLTDSDAVAADLVDKINNEPLVNSVLVAEQGTGAASDNVIVTAKTGGERFQYASGTDAPASETQANAEADAVPFGRFVTLDGQSSTDGELLCKLPSQAGDVGEGEGGVALYTASYERDIEEQGFYPPNSEVNVLDEGPVHVPVEVDVSVGDDVYVRHTADGALDVIGGFAKASGTGLAELTGARWLRGSENGVAVLELL